MLLLQILSALFLFVNKLLLLCRKNKIAWTIGIAGLLIMSIYLYLQMILKLVTTNFTILIIHNIALTVLMLYAFILEHSNAILIEYGRKIKICMILLTMVVSSFLFYKMLGAHLVPEQFMFSITGLVGTLCMTFNTKKSLIISWILYTITHMIVSYIMFKTGSPIIGIFQILSGIISIIALIKIKKTP